MSAMKSVISPVWVRPLKLLASTVLALNVSVAASGEVLAQSKSQVIKQQIQTLQQSTQRWIQVKLSEQKLVAWEGNKPVYAIVVSTGKNPLQHALVFLKFNPSISQPG